MAFSFILWSYLLLVLLCLIWASITFFHFKKLKILPDISANKISKVFLIGSILLFILSLVFLIILIP